MHDAPDRRSALIVRNPRSRRAPAEAALARAARRLERAGWTIEVCTTRAPGHATELARAAAASGVAYVLACGGDGTAREVAEGIAHTETALGVIPAGTANVWAHETGVPSRVGAALAFAVRARPVRIDTGLVDGRRFLLMASTGLDAAVVREVEGGRAKRVLGRAAFVLPALRHALGAEAVPARIEVDGAVLERALLLGVAGNTRLYGGFARLTARAAAGDGLLDLCLLSEDASQARHRAAHRGRLAALALRGALPEAADRGVPGVDYRRATHVRIEAARPLPVQADGELIGETPVEVRIDPASLWVLAGPEPNPLFASA